MRITPIHYQHQEGNRMHGFRKTTGEWSKGTAIFVLLVLAVLPGCVTNSKFDRHERQQGTDLDAMKKSVETVDARVGTEAKTLQDEIAKINGLLDEKQKTIEEAQGKIAELQKTCDQLGKDLLAAQVVMTTKMDQRIGEVNTRLDLVKPEQIKQDLQGMNSDIKDLRGNLGDFDKRIQQYDVVINSHGTQITAIKDEAKQEIKDRQSGDSQLNRQIESAQQDLSNKIEALGAAHKQRMDGIDESIQKIRDFLSKYMTKNVEAYDNLLKEFKNLRYEAGPGFSPSEATPQPATDATQTLQ
jgi:DNA repair exonuclease SbcCD ATPase subunit